MPTELTNLLGLFEHAGFLVGFGASAAVLAALYLTSKRAIPSRSGWAVLTAAVTVMGLLVLFELPPRQVVGLGLAAIAGLLADLVYRRGEKHQETPVRLPIVFIALGAALSLIAIDLNVPIWAAVALPLVVLLGASSLWVLRHPPFPAVVGPMFAITMLGVWATVPETDMVRVLLGASIPLGLSTLPPVSLRTSAAGSVALMTLFAWLVLDGGAGRVPAVIGGWASLGLIPILAIFGSKTRSFGHLEVFAFHAVVTFALTRVPDATDSIPWVLAWTAVILAVAMLIVGLRGRPGSSPPVSGFVDRTTSTADAED